MHSLVELKIIKKLKNAIDTIVMIGLSIGYVRRTGHFTLLCHVTEHTTFLRVVTASLTCVPIFRRIYCHGLRLWKTILFPWGEGKMFQRNSVPYHTPEDVTFQNVAAKLICFGILLRNCLIVLKVLNNHCFLLHKLVKTSRFPWDMLPAEQVLPDVESAGEDIPHNGLPVLSGCTLVRSFDGIWNR